jgi:hypothetical protein
MRRGAPFLITALLLFVLTSTAFAQSAQNGNLAGTVKDQTGAVLPGVTVEALSQQKGTTRSATSDAAGKFRLQALPIGAYTVTASLSGFETAKIKNAYVESDKTTDVSVALKLGTTAEAITVTGDIPVVDRTNVAVNARVRSEEFQKLPVGRSYQSLMGLTPGIPGTGGGNVTALGALSSNNLFLFDGVDTTDPTTGTFGSNLNFEAIQEVSIYTAGLSAEYGRALGAIVNVVTKSGGNTFSGSAKGIGTNDHWNEQNKTKDERCSRPNAPANPCTTVGASLARVKFDHVNPVQSYTLGGPFWKDHVWFFGSYEKSKNTTAQQQTVITRENFQQTTESPFWDGRVTAQLTPSQNVWVRGHGSPTNGFIVSYGAPAELIAYTRQDQIGRSTAAQYNGIFGTKISVEAFVAKQDDIITVRPYGLSSLTNGAVHYNLADGRYYNGSYFDGFVNRPRRQGIASVSLFEDFLGRSHDIKAGYDVQTTKSGNLFTFQNNQLFIDNTFDYVNRTFSPNARQDYDPPQSSTSNGRITAIYARDKLDLIPRLFVEAGVRYEKQAGKSDLGRATVDTQTWSPRLSMSYDLKGDGRSLIVGSYSRPYQFIIQDFSDQFAAVPQQGNYTNYIWNGTTYVKDQHFDVGGNSFNTNTKLKPTYVDEVTFGFQRQLGNTMGAGVRAIWRKWGNLIDDIFQLNADGSVFRQAVNYSNSKRNYRGVELTFEKRFSKNWNANVNYTWSRTRGNSFVDQFGSLGDYGNSNCRTTTDITIGTNGVIPCSVVNDGPNKFGKGNDFPHDLKAQGAYLFHFGPVNLTTALTGEYRSNNTFTKQIAMNVLTPGTTTNSGNTATYFYEPRGSERLPNTWFADSSLEATYRFWKSAEFGVKGEVFNITNHQDKTTVNLQTWCNNPSAAPTSTCQINRDRFGSATARGSFRGPRNYRITTLIRF